MSEKTQIITLLIAYFISVYEILKNKNYIFLCVVFLLSFCITRMEINKYEKNKKKNETYYNEIFYDPSCNYIVLGSDKNIELPAIPANSYCMKDKKKAFKTIDIGLYRRNELEHLSEGWTITSNPEGIVKVKISDDGEKLLLAGQKPGITEIHISHSEADFGKVINVMVTDDKTK